MHRERQAAPTQNNLSGAELERRRLPPAELFSDLTRARIDDRVRNGEVRRVRRGVYVPTTTVDGRALQREADVLAQMRGVAEKFSTDFWFSHTSAALLWGCWVWHLGHAVHITQLGNPKVRRAADPLVRRHWTQLPQRDRSSIDGVPVTSLERTVVDCARSLPEAEGLVVADAGLRIGARQDLLHEILRESAGKRGVRRARTVLGLSDHRSESPGESILRWVVHDGGLPAPELAVSVETWLGSFRLDLGWSDLKVALEFDGAVKYSGGRYGNPEQALVAEKRRHDALVEAGWLVIRVTWADLADPDRLVQRIREARRQARSPSRQNSPSLSPR